ncbi:putative anaerobic sulfatase maturation enzyme AslB [Vibrio crassostreae]|uniref:anaerobic sulfatase maturase n=1 Tax=Vibrio crassostreae TaxID=246167 RepID=UPI001B315A45|nr:anaerobic sulfatase maturase [Vibrio crassostreae]CAK2135221.1 putative anaerobic sulfatase maturation enzyme AslB [Vibrio crassostreae]CAK2154665.1 putative anaerobic sulfatase maturation enzyme AslB [Vibrio crassostreae]CAK2159789.1 putative anaerobic sulfatase maturation enzyme AslB [Vibrio crassostreae]CAK2164499.1 putative anaerobic sulfatase maturation enzyme AslB [Vibrio crassostreae]CAK2166430.1 putative anaerobic sulfatase maturation enzyme AslB [Vibrio crassostreae]
MKKQTHIHTTQMDLTPLKTAFATDGNNHVDRRFHVMAKPGGAKCNIDCQYCFYLHKDELLNQSKQPQMDDATLEAFIKSYIESHDGEEVVFSWQGGEPTLLGLGYFKKIVELQRKYAKTGMRIENDLQTNGLLLNKDWCEFLVEHSFLVGLSIDGPEFIHDKYRKTRSGKPTFKRVIQAVNLMKEYKVPFNALVTVNRFNSQYPLEVYRFLTQELGVTYIQFSPCVESRSFEKIAPHFWKENMQPEVGSELAKPGHLMSVVTDWSVDASEWGKFLVAVFNEWVNNDFGRVLVNLFETAVAQVMGMPAQLCVTAEFCGKGLAIEHNGDVFSCDHYVYPEYRLANINERPLNEIAISTRQYSFGMAKKSSLPQYCLNCEYLKYCWGECPKNRLLTAPNGESGLNYLCPGIKMFFEHALPILVGISTLLKSSNSSEYSQYNL